MIKRLTIIEKQFLIKNGKYFNNKNEKIALINYTDNQLKTELEELNRNARSRFFEVIEDYNLNNKADIIKFITEYLNNFSKNELVDIINNNFSSFNLSKLCIYQTKRKLKVDISKNRFFKRSEENGKYFK